jgi:hypothetical protein
MLIRVTIELDDGTVWTKVKDMVEDDEAGIMSRLRMEEIVSVKFELDGTCESPWQYLE